MSDRPDSGLNLNLLKTRLAVCRLDPGAELPGWFNRALSGAELAGLVRTESELSLVLAESASGHDRPGVEIEPGWRAMKVQGVLDFSLIGILHSLTGPLARAGVSIFALSTFDTDYILIKEKDLPRALNALREAGHLIVGSEPEE